jgi:hypothetical protein
MGFFGDFFGSSQRKDLQQSKGAADAALQQGYNTAQGNYTNAQGMFNPYAQQGQQANTMYGNALGLNGLDAQKSFGANYAASDPFRQQNADFANNALMRQYNARGQTYGGSTDLAVSRANLERGSQDYNNYLNRLQGQGQQGYQATSAQAGLEQGKGDLAMGYGQTRAGNEINYGNALAQSRSIGINNLLGLAGTAAKAYGAYANIPGSNAGGGKIQGGNGLSW